MTAHDHLQAGKTVPATQDSVARERYLTIEELSAATTLSVSTIRRLVKKGVFVSHQPGGPRHRIVFPPDAIEQAAKSAKTSEAERPPNKSRSGTVGRPLRGPQPKWFRQS